MAPERTLTTEQVDAACRAAAAEVARVLHQHLADADLRLSVLAQLLGRLTAESTSAHQRTALLQMVADAMARACGARCAELDRERSPGVH